MNYRVIIWAVVLLAFVSCDMNFSDDRRGDVVARVYDKYLYTEDIAGLVNKGMSPEDSIVWVRNYIYNWARQQLIITKAEFNLSDREKDFDELVEQYRYDLLKFTYQQRYVDEHIDTVITEAEIKAYYEEHKSDFELKENIVKVNYLILSNGTPDIDKARAWFRSSEADDQRRLEDYALRYAQRFNLTDTAWVRFNDLAKFVPLQTYNQQEFLNRNKYVDLEADDRVFLVKFLNYRIAEDVSPLTYVQTTVRNIILNKRKQQIIASMEERLVNDAYEKKDFEIY